MEIFFGAAGAIIAALFLTAFVKILTTLNILRYGMGLGDAPFGLVIAGLSMALSLVVMNGRVTANGGVDGLMKMNSVFVEEAYRPFLEQHADKKIIERLTTIQNKIAVSQGRPVVVPSPEAKAAEPKSTPFTVLTAAFLITEISAACMLGVLFLIPFVVIDLAVSNLLMALGVTQISQHVVTLPLKLLLFVAVDGWSLVSEKLLTSYLS